MKTKFMLDGPTVSVLKLDEDQLVEVLSPRNPGLAGEVSRAFEPVK